MDTSHKGATSTAIITLVVGLVIGVGGGYAVASMNKDDTKTDSSSNASMASDNSGGEDGVTVGGAKMVASKDIVANAQNAKNVTTVVSLVQKAGLVETLQSTGPFTVFAPNNDAFGKLPKATVDSLQQPENVDQLKTILTYHVVPGTYTSADLRAMAQKGQTLTSVQGGVLTPVVDGGKVMIKDAKGNMIAVQTADVISSNGVTHVVDSVMMPQ